MAFNFNQNTGNNSNNESWRSDAFINFYLPTENGERRKLGSIGLKNSRKQESQLIEYLKEYPEMVKAVLAQAEIEFRLADSSTDGFVLPTVVIDDNG